MHAAVIFPVHVEYLKIKWRILASCVTTITSIEHSRNQRSSHQHFFRGIFTGFAQISRDRRLRPGRGGDPWTPQPTTLLHPAPTACTTQLQWLTRSAVAAGYHQDVRGWSVDDDDDGDDVDDDGESGTAAGRSGFSRCDRRSPSISVPPVDLLRQSSPSSTRCKPDHESVNGLVVDI